MIHLCVRLCVRIVSTFISTLACSEDNSVAQCKQACKRVLFFSPPQQWLFIFCVCVCDLREVKFDCNGVRATIICNIRYLNVQVCVNRIKMKHSSLFRWVLTLLFLSFSSSVSLSSPLHQTLPFQSSDPGNERNASFPPHYLLSSLSLPPVFLLTLPSSSYSIFILILCHLTPLLPRSSLYLSSLSLSRQSFFPSVSILSQSLSTSFLAASSSFSPHPHPSLSLSLSSPPRIDREHVILCEKVDIVCVHVSLLLLVM